jgi:hypothetical protein
MARRLSEEFAAKVSAALDSLEILQVEKDQMEFELVPVIAAAQVGQTFSFMVCLSMPVGHGTGDYVMPMAHCGEPHPSEQALREFVGRLAGEALRLRDEAVIQVNRKLNGHQGGTPRLGLASP